MGAFLGRSAIQKFITLFFVSVISFLIIHLAPGEPRYCRSSCVPAYPTETTRGLPY